MAISADNSLIITAAIGQYSSLNIKDGQTRAVCEPIIPKPTILFAKRTPYNADGQSGPNVQGFDIQGVGASSNVATKDSSKKGDKQRKRKRKAKRKKISPLSSRRQKHGQDVLLPAVESKPLYVGMTEKPAYKTAQERNITYVVEYFKNQGNRRNAIDCINQGVSPADVIMADIVDKSRAEQIKATKELRTSFLKGTSVPQGDLKEVIVAKFPPLNPHTAVYDRSGTAEEMGKLEDLTDATVNGKYKPILERQRRRKGIKTKQAGSSQGLCKNLNHSDFCFQRLDEKEK